MLPSNVLDTISNTRIAPSPIHGLGLWASVAMAPHTTLCALDGQLMDYAFYEQLVAGRSDLPFIEWNALPGDRLLVRFVRTKYSFINHSREPNCEVLAHSPASWGFLQLRTCKPIPSGGELLLDYRKEPLPSGYLAGHGSTYL